MLIRYVPTLRKLMHRIFPVVRAGGVALFLAILLACVSCSREDFSLREEQSTIVVSVDVDSSGAFSPARYSLSLYVDVGFTIEPEELQFSVTTPDGLDNWEFFPALIEFDGVRWLGHSNISLGAEVPVPKGDWSLRLFLKDGRTIEHSFSVAYDGVSPVSYPVVAFASSADGQRVVVLTTSGQREAMRNVLLDVPRELNEKLLPVVHADYSGMPDSSGSSTLVPAVSVAPPSSFAQSVSVAWNFELMNQTGEMLYQGEISPGLHSLTELGGTLWDNAKTLVLYRYIPESRITFVCRQTLRD